MCGIAGLLNFDGQQPSEHIISSMMSVIHHRGPNDGKLWIGDRVGLGFRRLSIIDVAEGAQPLSNEDDSVWIVFNGEIYNYMELRNDLIHRGHQFKTHTDTEVIVHLYEEHGEDCVHHLRGMFGFAIWDRNKQQLFLARDHFGIKPVYYFYNHDMFAFGSEIKSLLTVPGMPRQLNMNSFYNYLTFQYVPDPDTMYDGIHKLPPAHTITIPFEGAPQIRKYWDPMFDPMDRPLSQVLEEIRDVMTDSVKHHLHSEVQRGCFLSSGIDSTITSTLMRSMEPIKTFSVGFEGANNETIIARDTARQIDTEHYDRMITEEMYFDAVPRAIWHLDEPIADPSAIALYEVARLAREHVTVVLSGEGADELFGGYRIYREPHSLRYLSWMPEGMQRSVNQMLKKMPNFYGKNYLMRGTTPLEERFLGNANIFSDDTKLGLLRATEEQIETFSKPFDKAKLYYDRTKHLDPVSRMQYIDMNLWMPGDILMKADKLTMAHSMELRVPFLDRKVFDVARRIPMKYRIAEGTTKYALRKAMQGVIPDSVLNRPKLGFPVPMRDWMRTQRADTMWEHISASGIDPIINLSAVEDMFRRHKAGQGDYSRKLWVLYVFALWHATFIKHV
ncbi:asparagine synthase (glutamine-hydrolyzing) [Paenibacillus sp. ACRRX]|uniref:asparagine synthase (glutamine-hydrolyzing) n=1 Tax=unclassified Paenibacillus TaxID=185978 RepID=UPI001EF4EE7B|nr:MULTISPECIES: asparagine synthase (glutamine-hydrolyzing) [unclassified Paenibacillus]MCG7408572.1 asparagine synthase (glutamine-hydrolyzing) [Paenibacillus sp. ACRRX]MDK8182820.1 asparagine synthase (glutamine-hydrolyzing) [Paenibacillus sp. UMB4589-SE434]